MFTGIVEATGVIESLDHGAAGGRMVVRAPEVAPRLKVSDSVAVNGCCLTVVELGAETFSADLSGETLARTAFGERKAGSRVNLELPLTAGASFGGHFVQGHVDGVGRVTRLAPDGGSWWLSVRVPEELGRYVALKGSIAIDGVSLTVAGWHDAIADVAVIPFTYQHTSIGEATLGDAVNIECDILAKYVERLIDARDGAASLLTVAKLNEEGF